MPMKSSAPQTCPGVPPEIPISEIGTFKEGTISSISSDNSALVKKLTSMGFVPGRKISLKSIVSDKGARVVKIGDSTIAIDLEMSSAIYVRV